MDNTQKIKTIILCKGIQASGKTTWAKEQLKKYPGKYKRVNRDDLRAMLDDSAFSPDNELFTGILKEQIILKALARGYDVIVDDTNLKDKTWFLAIEVAKKIGNVRVMEKFFDVDLKTALRRNQERGSNIPDHVIVEFFNKFIKRKRIEVRDEFIPKVNIEFKEDPSKTKAIIVDIDGTLALNNVGRSQYDMSRVIEDDPNIPIINIVNLLSKEYTVIVVSGREDDSIEDTQTWLYDKGINYDALFMRIKGDNRKDSIVKKEIYEKYIKDNFDIQYVLDDRNQTVDMWRSIGLCCLQVAYGDF